MKEREAGRSYFHYFIISHKWLEQDISLSPVNPGWATAWKKTTNIDPSSVETTVLGMCTGHGQIDEQQHEQN